MRRSLVSGLLSLLIVGWLAAAPGGGNILAAPRPSSIPANVDISRRHGNEAEEAIAVNPTNPNNIV
ncbi:MAG TPA: hypothetical protein VF972_00340, partial [Actinomycetota bacterium]